MKIWVLARTTMRDEWVTPVLDEGGFLTEEAARAHCTRRNAEIAAQEIQAAQVEWTRRLAELRHTSAEIDILTDQGFRTPGDRFRARTALATHTANAPSLQAEPSYYSKLEVWDDPIEVHES